MGYITAFIVWSLALYASNAEKDAHNDFPEEHMTTCQVVEYYGYPCETHEVTTKDGYILVLHRIPNGVKNQTRMNNQTNAVLLQHGIVQSSITWVINGPAQSLGFLLADQGFDVWMGNSRGNTYSFKHVTLLQDREEYWDFSFSEMAKFDLPAMIDYVLKVTSQNQLNFIGHSQGNTIGFAAFSTFPSLTRKVRMFIALAPITYMKHAKGLLKLLSDIQSPLTKWVLGALGKKSFLPSNYVTKFIAQRLCSGSITSRLCASVLFMICGYGSSNLDGARIPLYLSHFPAGTSVKDILHYSQLIQNGKFSMYDYGWNGNMHKYLQPTPPKYDLSKIKVPVALFYGTNDWLSTVEDISAHLQHHHLPKLIYSQLQDGWNNMDFVWGTGANDICYENAINLLRDPIPE